MMDIWQHFSLPYSETVTLHAAVRASDWRAGIDRAKSDDPVWGRPDVNYHGTEMFNPTVARVRHKRGFIAWLQ